MPDTTQSRGDKAAKVFEFFAAEAQTYKEQDDERSYVRIQACIELLDGDTAARLYDLVGEFYAQRTKA